MLQIHYFHTAVESFGLENTFKIKSIHCPAYCHLTWTVHICLCELLSTEVLAQEIGVQENL